MKLRCQRFPLADSSSQKKGLAFCWRLLTSIDGSANLTSHRDQTHFFLKLFSFFSFSRSFSCKDENLNWAAQAKKKWFQRKILFFLSFVFHGRKKKITRKNFSWKAFQHWTAKNVIIKSPFHSLSCPIYALKMLFLLE